jgi:hypothetical protein
MIIHKTIRALKHRLKGHPVSRREVVLSVQDRLLIASSAINAMRSRNLEIKALWEAEIRVFSQWGEDGILTYLLDSVGIAKPKILEIGAGNFEECNSRFQAEFRNASVYAVDLRSDLEANCKTLDVFWRSIIIPVNDYITPNNINSHIKSAKSLLGGLDIFSLDVDGNDYWILHEADLSDISIVVCEYNPLFGHSKSVTVPREDNFSREAKHFSWLYYGMSIKANISLMQKKGFVFCGSNLAGNNAFFIKEEFEKKLNFDIPSSTSLASHTDWRVREARDENGQLSFLFGEDRASLIKSLKVIETKSNSLIDLESVI